MMEEMAITMKLYTYPRPTPNALRMMEEMAITSAQTATKMRDIIRICSPDASGLIYVREMSYERSDETAMHSAEPVERMAMVSWIITRMPPVGPSNAMAEAGGTRPEPASPAVSATLSALPARPRAVASAKGMVNHTRPPRMYPLCAAPGLAAMADCQYDWSTKTVPKLPMML